MSNNYDIINPIWDNKERTRVKCQIIMTSSDGEETKHIALINDNSPDWDIIIEKYGLEYIDEKTKEVAEKSEQLLKEKQEKDRENHVRQKERSRLEKLFTRKLEIFEIEDIKNSEDKEAKARIRKAKNETEALVYAAILMMKES